MNFTTDHLEQYPRQLMTGIVLIGTNLAASINRTLPTNGSFSPYVLKPAWFRSHLRLSHDYASQKSPN